jgi:hypothetical protein
MVNQRIVACDGGKCIVCLLMRYALPSRRLTQTTHQEEVPLDTPRSLSTWMRGSPCPATTAGSASRSPTTIISVVLLPSHPRRWWRKREGTMRCELSLWEYTVLSLGMGHRMY